MKINIKNKNYESKKQFSHLLPMQVNLAQIANNITTYKKQLRDLQKSFDKGKDNDFKEHVHGQLKVCNQTIINLQSEYRHMHIAYCELRGTTRDRIEQNPSERSQKNLKEQMIKNFKAGIGIKDAE